MFAKNRVLFIVFLICILASFIRLYRLSEIPNSLSGDEVSFGYNAYSILDTGRDEYGRLYPLLFEAFNDHKNPIFVYLLVPFIKFFGLTEFSIRFPSSIIVILTIPIFFLITKRLTKNTKLSLITIFLSSITPWLIHYSRIALEVNAGFFFSILGVWVFLKAEEKGRNYFLATVAFALAFWTYYASKLWVLLFGIYLIIFKIKVSKRITRAFVFSVLIFLLSVFPYIKLYLDRNILSRQYGISIFNNQEENNRNAKLLAEDLNRGDILARITHNRRWIFFNQLSNGYLYIINPTYLFAQDNANHMPKIRLLYLWQIPLILLGLFSFRRWRNWWLFIFFWLAIGYIPGAITILPAFDRRILINSFPFILLTAVGVDAVMGYLKKVKLRSRILSSLLLLTILLFSFYSFVHFYFFHGQTAAINLWGNGMKELVSTVSGEKYKYDKVIVSTQFDSPWIYFLFYEKYSPSKYLAKGGTVSGDFREERNYFDKYYFKNILSDELKKDSLYVWTAGEEFACIKIKNKVYQSDGKLFAFIGNLDLECSTQP